MKIHFDDSQFILIDSFYDKNKV